MKYPIKIAKVSADEDLIIGLNRNGVNDAGRTRSGAEAGVQAAVRAQPRQVFTGDAVERGEWPTYEDPSIALDSNSVYIAVRSRPRVEGRVRDAIRA